MIRAARFAVVLAVCFVSIPTFLAAFAADPVPVWVPFVDSPDAPLLEGTTWVIEAEESHQIWIKRVEEAERLSFLERAIGMRIDPFATPPGETPRFMTFLMVIENQGEGQLDFNPMKVWMETDKKEFLAPISLDDLAFLYRVNDQDLPSAYRNVEPTLLYIPRPVSSGETVSGLLVYKAFKPKTKSFDLDGRITLPNGDEAKFVAPYRRLSKKEMKERDVEQHDQAP